VKRREPEEVKALKEAQKIDLLMAHREVAIAEVNLLRASEALTAELGRKSSTFQQLKARLEQELGAEIDLETLELKASKKGG